MTHRLVQLTVAVLSGILLCGCSTPDRGHRDAVTPPVSPTVGSSAADVAMARAALSTLVIAPDEPDMGWRRSLFGRSWLDPDRNGCNARADVLRRDVPGVQPTTGCARTGGVLHDPYTGRDVPCCAQVQIDHRYPLHRAYEHGAAGWTSTRRLAFANDPLELVATAASANEAKGDRGPGMWMPAPSDWCAYGVTYVLVASRYGLSVTQADHAALEDALATCPG